MTEFNWSQLMSEADVGIVPVPAGEYEVQCATAVVKPTSTGKQMIVCRYNIVSGPHQGRTAYNQVTLTTDSPPAMGFFFRNMKAHGLDANFFAANPTLEQVAENLVGKLAHVKIGVKNVNGDDRNSMDGFSPSQLQGGAPVAAPAPVTAAPAFPGAPPMAAPPMAPPMAPPVAAAPMAPPMAPAPPVAPPAPPMAPPVAPVAPVAAPVAPPAVARQFDPATGMEAVNGAWTWPAEQAAGYVWNQAANMWVAPAAGPVAPPMPPAPPAPSF